MPLLKWWTYPVNLTQGNSLHLWKLQLKAFTDGSNWRAHCGDKNNLEQNSQARSHKYIRARGIVPRPKSFPNPCIRKGSDDLDRQFNSAVSHLESGRDTLPSNGQLSLELLIWCSQNRIHSRVQYITGEKNVIADALSHTHQIQTTGWSLNPEVLKNLCNDWGTWNIDLFSTQLNHKLPVYVSPLSHAGA